MTTLLFMEKNPHPEENKRMPGGPRKAVTYSTLRFMFSSKKE